VETRTVAKQAHSPSLFLGTGYELALLRFGFLSLGDASASANEKKIKIDSKESILILLCFRPDTK